MILIQEKNDQPLLSYAIDTGILLNYVITVVNIFKDVVYLEF